MTQALEAALTELSKVKDNFNEDDIERLFQNVYLELGFLQAHEPRFRSQRMIKQFIVDFYCPAAKLVIEVDGESHFTDEGKAKDVERTAVLENLGLYVLRFTNYEVMKEFEGVCSRISEVLASRANVGPLSVPPTRGDREGSMSDEENNHDSPPEKETQTGSLIDVENSQENLTTSKRAKNPPLTGGAGGVQPQLKTSSRKNQ
jgi:very-short-patch-repair endonuclease